MEFGKTEAREEVLVDVPKALGTDEESFSGKDIVQ